MQALCQALIPFSSLGYAPGSACTDSVAAAAQARLDELSMPSAVQLLWTLAYLQALPGRAWTMLMSCVVDQLQPFADLAGEAVPACQTISSMTVHTAEQDREYESMCHLSWAVITWKSSYMADISPIYLDANGFFVH